MFRLRRLLRPMGGFASVRAEAQVPNGQRLCEEAGLDFCDTFSQQFRLSPHMDAELPGFTRHQLGDWWLDVGPSLPVALASYAGGSGMVAFLGVGVDHRGQIVTSSSLSSILSRVNGAHQAADILSECAGRYAFFVIDGPTQRLYLDPMGTLGAVYDPQERRVASTVNLALMRGLMENTTYPFSSQALQGSGRFAFCHTADQIVTRLLPNHFLDLTNHRQTRHWPGPLDIDEPTERAQVDMIVRIADRLEQVTQALALHADTAYLHLNGGIETRVLAACSVPALDNLTPLSTVDSRMARKGARVAARVANRLKSTLTQIDPGADSSQRIESAEQLNRLSQAYYIATAGPGMPHIGHHIEQGLEADSIVLRSDGVEILRALQWRRAVREFKRGVTHDTARGLRMMALGEGEADQNREMRMEYERWYSSLPGLAAKRSFDFAYCEQKVPHDLGNSLYGRSRAFHVCPFSDRALIGAATSLPPDQRAALDYMDALIDWRAPQLTGLGYNSPEINQLLDARRDHGVPYLKIA